MTDHKETIPADECDHIEVFRHPNPAIELLLCPECNTVFMNATAWLAAREARATPVKCLCGYEASDENDLEQHTLAMMHVFDGQHHGEAH